MAEQNIRDALKSCYDNLNIKYERRQIDKQTQIVLVSRFNLREAFIEAYGRAKVVQPELMDLDLAAFSNAAIAALEAVKSYVRSSNSATIKREGVTFVQFVQRTGTNQMPFVKAKFAGKKVLEAEAKTTFSRKANVAINQSIVRSHEGALTTGMKVFASMFDQMREHPTLQGFVTSVEATRLTDKFDLRMYFERDPVNRKRKFSIRAGRRVILEVVKSSDNPAGSNANDWILIAPKLEAATLSWAKRVKWEDQRGSSTPSEEIADKTANHVRNILVKGLNKKGFFIVTPDMFSEAKPKSYKPVVYTPPRDSSKINLKYTKKKSKTGLKKVPTLGSSEINLNNLLGVLNEILPKIVADNMGSPALNYQTGEFSSSVRVLNIQRTGKGNPIISYTYQKYPYQTFEPGYAQGSKERDPRTLIDSAIRDAARGLMTARFSTRRV